MATDVRSLLDYIGRLESNGNYNAYYGNASPNNGVDFSGMTVKEVMKWQKDFASTGTPSSVIGKYQFHKNTLKGLVSKLGISPDTPFTPALQDQLAYQLLKDRGLRKWEQGIITSEVFANNLAQEWAALPVVNGSNVGLSYYAKDGLNKARDTPESFLGTLKSVSGHPVPPNPLGDEIPGSFNRNRTAGVFVPGAGFVGGVGESANFFQVKVPDASQLAFQRSVAANRPGYIDPDAARNSWQSNTAVPVPRPSFRSGGTAPPGTVPLAALPSFQTIANAARPGTFTTSPTGGVITNQQLQAIRDPMNAARSQDLTTRMVQTVRIDPSTGQVIPNVPQAGLSAPGAGFSQEQMQRMRDPGVAPKIPPNANTTGPTVYVRPDGTQVPAVTRSGSPTGQPSPGYMPSPTTVKPGYITPLTPQTRGVKGVGAATTGPKVYSPTPSKDAGTGNIYRLAPEPTRNAVLGGTSGVGGGAGLTTGANANLTQAKEEQKYITKPTTITKTIMVPNPAYMPPPGYANTPTGGFIPKSQLDAIRGVPASSYQQPYNVPKMIPKTVTETVYKQVPVPVVKPATVQQKQDDYSAAAYEAKNEAARTTALSKASNPTAATQRASLASQWGFD